MKRCLYFPDAAVPFLFPMQYLFPVIPSFLAPTLQDL